MSYEKNIWKTGDIVTSEKLNHIEQGIEAGGSSGGGGGMFIISTTDYDEEEGTWSKIDKNFQEIQTAIDNGQMPILLVRDSGIVEYVYHLSRATSTQIIFSRIRVDSKQVVEISVTVQSNGEITTSSKSMAKS